MDTLVLNRIILPFEECVSPSLPNVGRYDFLPPKTYLKHRSPQFRCDWMSRVCFKQVPSTQEFPRWWQLKYLLCSPLLGGK